MGDLSNDFSKWEFKCPCGCRKDVIDPGLVKKLQFVRNLFDAPITITSGFRCEDYNREIGGEENSAHIYGLAADIACVGSSERYNLSGPIIQNFLRYGIDPKFIHVDVSEARDQEVAWLY